MYCKYCGEKIKSTDNFCNKCGKKLKNTADISSGHTDLHIHNRESKKGYETYGNSYFLYADQIENNRESKKGYGTYGAIIIIVVILVAGLWFFQQIRQREALKNVQIDIDGIGVKSIGLSGATLNIGLRMYNPNGVTATLDRIEYGLYGNSNYIGNGIINQRIDIPPRGSRTTETEFYISYGGALKVIWSALNNGNVNWRMTGTAHFDTPLGTLDISFDT